jgi:HEAT repeat protein
MRKWILMISVVLAIAIAMIPKAIDSYRASSQESRALSEDNQKTDEFLKRLKDEKHSNILGALTWTLTHDYEDLERMEVVLLTSERYLNAVAEYEKGDSTELQRLGGIERFKDQLATWLDDSDQAIRSFAATMLGVSGDQAYAPQVAKLLVRKVQDPDRQYDRASAARALGLIQAKEFGKDLVPMLASSNKSDRTGALDGLAWMGDKEHAPAVAKLLNDDDEDIRATAREALKVMGASELIKDEK